MIKFPKVHIAQSVVNRILETRDELRRTSAKSGGGAPAPVPPPAVPDPSATGAALDVATGTPAAPASSPGDPAEGAIDAALAGKPALDGITGAL